MLGKVEGTIDIFTDPSNNNTAITEITTVTLGPAPITFSNRVNSFRGINSTPQKNYIGQWAGQFYGNGQNTTDQPGSVAGTFSVTNDDSDTIIGTFFGAYNCWDITDSTCPPYPANPLIGNLVKDLYNSKCGLGTFFLIKAKNATKNTTANRGKSTRSRN